MSDPTGFALFRPSSRNENSLMASYVGELLHVCILLYLITGIYIVACFTAGKMGNSKYPVMIQ